MTREFLGSGWKFPVKMDCPARPDEPAKIAVSQHEEDIREAIMIILGTSRGERAMRPDFGSDLDQFVFAVFNSQTKGMIEESVREALIMWEPRIEVKSINASQDGPEDERIAISIDYLVRVNNNEFNLVYPFYLKE
jgi:uncharacterized protein